MKHEPQLILINVAPEIVHGRPVMVKGKHVGIVPAKIETENTAEGLLISVRYDASPFPESIPKPSKFYLTQQEFDEYLGNPTTCILSPPEN